MLTRGRNTRIHRLSIDITLTRCHESAYTPAHVARNSGNRMADQNTATDEEVTAIQSVLNALGPLDPGGRQRVYEYVGSRLRIVGDGVEHGSFRSDGESGDASRTEDYGSFAEFYESADPQSNAVRVLVASYWLQEHEENDSFVSFDVNKALKDLGHGVSNITAAFSALKQQKPALVLQVKKAGKSRQARKTYKLTKAGLEVVKEMLGG